MYSYSNRFAVSSVLVSQLLFPCIGFKGVVPFSSTTDLKPGTQHNSQEYFHSSEFNLPSLNSSVKISVNLNLEKNTQTKNVTNTLPKNSKNIPKKQEDEHISANNNKKPPTVSKNIPTKVPSSATTNTTKTNNNKQQPTFRSLPISTNNNKKPPAISKDVPSKTLSAVATKDGNIKHKSKQSVIRRLPISEASMIDEAMRGKLPTFAAHDGYEVIFMYQQGEWVAYVTQHLAVGHRILVLPVYRELGVSIDDLLNSAPEWQERHIYVCLPAAALQDKSAPYVYISMVEMQDNGLRVDVNRTLANLVLGYQLTGHSNQIEEYGLKSWKNMLLEINNLLAGIKVNLVISSIDPNPGRIKTELEQIIYKYLHRQVKLENYSLTYNQILTEIIDKIESKRDVSTYHPLKYPESYLVTLKVKLRNIYPLLLEINRIKDIQTNKPVSFDLTKIVETIAVNVSSKDLPSHGGLLSKITDPFFLVQKQEEVMLSTVLPSLTANPSYQVFEDNRVNSYPTSREQMLNEHMNEVDVFLDEYDLPSSMHIPHLIRLDTGDIVRVTFGSSLKQPENLVISADRLVDQRLIPTLIQALNKANETVKIESIHISATTNGHEGKRYATSNHRKENGARAIDISRINGKNIFDLGANNPLIIALQNALDEAPYIRENFGPYFRHKKRKDYKNHGIYQGHKNHIHFSINR